MEHFITILAFILTFELASSGTTATFPSLSTMAILCPSPLTASDKKGPSTPPPRSMDWTRGWGQSTPSGPSTVSTWTPPALVANKSLVESGVKARWWAGWTEDGMVGTWMERRNDERWIMKRDTWLSSIRLNIECNNVKVCHHKLSIHITITLFLFKNPNGALQMCNITFKHEHI